MISRALVAAACLIVMLGPPVSAASPSALTERVAEKVMSPYCPGLTLAACPSEEARKLRGRIEAWARQGLGEERIMRRLENELGPEVRAVPSGADGFWAWALPAVFLGTGAAVLLLTVGRWTGSTPGRKAPLDATARARVDEELASWRANPEGRP
jgi:cytochrome c-type biogenesis protein CcmH/NrfF